MSNSDPYAALGVPRDATAAQIKAAHRTLAKGYHPDVTGGDRTKFDQIQAAYELLMDPDRRRRFNETGDASEQRPENPLTPVIGLIAGTMDAVLGELQAPTDTVDMVALICNKLRAEKAEHETIRQRFLIGQAQVALLLGSFKPKGPGQNLMQGLVEAKMRHMDELLKSRVAMIALHDEALEMMRQYIYAFKHPMMHTVTGIALNPLGSIGSIFRGTST